MMKRFAALTLLSLGILLVATTLTAQAFRHHQQAVYPWMVYASETGSQAELSLYRLRPGANTPSLLLPDEMNGSCFVISPDGLKVVYVTPNPVGEHDLNLLWLTDNQRQVLMENYHHVNARCPVWSPDSTWLLVTPNELGNNPVLRVNLTGSVEQLIDNSRQTFLPYLSPDTRYIALTSFNNGKNEVWLMRTDGDGDLQQLPITRPDDVITWAEWSPDSRWLYFVYNHRNNALHRYTIQDGTTETIFDGAGLNLTRIKPTWSPDGSQMVMTLQQDNGRSLLALVTDAGWQSIAETVPSHPCQPQWSPDGTWVAFVGIAFGKDELFRVRPDGSGLEKLTHNPSATYRCYEWSPDGDKLIFGARENRNIDLYQLDLASRSIQPLAQHSGDDEWIGRAALPKQDFPIWLPLSLGLLLVLLGMVLYGHGIPVVSTAVPQLQFARIRKDVRANSFLYR
jgi:Tol biopolymer transport system component